MVRVSGPLEEGRRNFVNDFLDHAPSWNLWKCSPGDVLAHDAFEVMYGNILSATVDPPVPAADGDEPLQRIRFRARIRQPAGDSCVQLPAGHVLVKGVSPRDTPEGGASRDKWFPVSAAAINDSWALALLGEAVVEFLVYDAVWNFDPATLPLGAVWVCTQEEDIEVLECPSLREIWDRHQSARDDVEGVVFADGMVPAEVVGKLNREIDKFVASQASKDYHPNTNNVVLDIVHPSLYPFIAGVSKLEGQMSSIDPCKGFPGTDRGGREFTESKFAWLPANLQVSEDGSCKFTSVRLPFRYASFTSLCYEQTSLTLPPV
jgi:Protein of unknown function (DUF4246)